MQTGILQHLSISLWQSAKKNMRGDLSYIILSASCSQWFIWSLENSLSIEIEKYNPSAYLFTLCSSSIVLSWFLNDCCRLTLAGKLTCDDFTKTSFISVAAKELFATCVSPPPLKSEPKPQGLWFLRQGWSRGHTAFLHYFDLFYGSRVHLSISTDKGGCTYRRGKLDFYWMLFSSPTP